MFRIVETEFFVIPTNLAIWESFKILCCFINQRAESGLSCLFESGIYFFIFVSEFDILISELFISKGLFSSLEDNSISSLESWPDIIGL